jgi:hypothetical protein
VGVPYTPAGRRGRRRAPAGLGMLLVHGSVPDRAIGKDVVRRYVVVSVFRSSARHEADWRAGWRSAFRGSGSAVRLCFATTTRLGFVQRAATSLAALPLQTIR